MAHDIRNDVGSSSPEPQNTNVDMDKFRSTPSDSDKKKGLAALLGIVLTTVGIIAILFLYLGGDKFLK